MTLEEHITQRFEKLFADYRKELARARKRGSEEAVHQLRVASRRILENLKVFEGAILRRAGASHPPFQNIVEALDAGIGSRAGLRHRHPACRKQR
ncbi:MAG: CHAD domain-containing protein [Bryobacterales bacterium]|nr:CHAD domain-containing protein [Bryobacterales bacterium]